MARTSSVLAIAACFISQCAFSSSNPSTQATQQSGGMTMQMPMVAPLFIQGSRFTSTLVIVNAANVEEYADVSIRSLDGLVVASRRINIAPHDQQQVEVADLVKTSGRNDLAGSIIVMPSPGSGSAVAAALSITYRTNPESNYIDEELAMLSPDGSQTLRAAADSGSGSPVLAITSLSDSVQHVKVDCLNRNRVLSKLVEVGPEQTLITTACNNRSLPGNDFHQALENSEVSPGKEPFGIAVSSDGMPGSFAAFGLTPHERGSQRFFSSIAFVDPKMEMSSTGVFVGVPVGRSPFLNRGQYTPQATLANFGANDIQATVQYAQSTANVVNFRDLTVVTVPPMSTREVVLSGLEGDPELRNSFLVTSNAAAGDLVSKLVAKATGTPREVELLARDAIGPENGGNHPWSLSGGTESFLLLFNDDQRVQTFSVTIAGANAIWSKSYKLQAMQTKLLDIRAIMRNKERDDHGFVLPSGLVGGEVSWFNRAGSGRGRILQANSAIGLARNFSCFMFAAPCSPATLDLVPSSIAVGGQSSAEFNYQICAAPDQFSCSGPPSSGSEDFPTSWSSQNTSIASAAGGAGNIGSVTGEGAGTTEIIATAENEFGTCSVGAGADVTVVSPDHVKVVVDQQGYPSACPTTGVYVRQMQMQVVDSKNNAIPSDAYIQESFSNMSSNTCGNGQPIPASCALTGDGGVGEFIDTMAVSGNFCGSGIRQASGCGFSVTSTWHACSGSGSNTLWSSPRVTLSNEVQVNGSTSGFAPGTQFH